jgi:hypothetical protein
MLLIFWVCVASSAQIWEFGSVWSRQLPPTQIWEFEEIGGGESSPSIYPVDSGILGIERLHEVLNMFSLFECWCCMTSILRERLALAKFQSILLSSFSRMLTPVAPYLH